jgi:phytoene dehydrogenase-like protein
MPDVLIIGGGVNGLVAAARLSARKLSTLVLERQAVAGGAAVTAEIAQGFRVPRLSHGLGPLRRDVVRGLKLDRGAGLDLLAPDPALTTLGPDGRTISFHPDPVLTAGSIHRVSSRDAGRWREFLEVAQRVTWIGDELARRAPPSFEPMSLRDRWRWLRSARRIRRAGRANITRAVRWTAMPIKDVLDEWFADELLKAAIAARALFGQFAGPRSPGTGGLWLQRLAEDPSPVGSGATIRGGPGALPAALAAAIETNGGSIRTNARVSRILARDGRAVGVELEGGEPIEAATIVSGVDPQQTLLALVDRDELPLAFVERVQHYRARGVTAKINLALSGLPVFPALAGDPLALQGRLLVAPDLDYLERAFDAAKYGAFSPEPWLELTIPSVLDASLAPEGRHVMSICVHAAPRHLRGGAWTEQRDALYRAAMRVLEAHTPSLESLIVAREIVTPEDLEREWGLSGGHVFHGEPSLDQFWIARPLPGWAQYRTPLDGLFLAGAGTHPGGGLTGGSGWLAAGAVIRARG